MFIDDEGTIYQRLEEDEVGEILGEWKEGNFSNVNINDIKRIVSTSINIFNISLSQIIIDTAKGYFNTALIKVFTTIIFTLLLNFLCSSGLGIIFGLLYLYLSF